MGMLQSSIRHIRRGEYWQRLIIVKDKRTHRLVHVTVASAMMQAANSTIKIPITCVVDSLRGSILMVLSEAETADLVDGTYYYDVVADAGRLRTIETGTIEVSTVAQITPLEGTFDMQITYRQRTDYRLDFSWTDSVGTLITAADARMQARTSASAIALDLKWYATAPSESTVVALTPTYTRGYLAPKTGTSLTMHISDTNTIAAGSYSFDIQAKDAAGDWDTVATGTLVVLASITDRST
jgi:hypothetical protein